MCHDFSVIRSFRGLSKVGRVIDIGLRYALFETPKDVGWFRSVERVPEEIRCRLERVSFGAWSMFNIGLRLVSNGWRLIGVRYYGGGYEEVEGDSVEYITYCLSNSEAFFGIRSITLVDPQNDVKVEMDALISLITVCWRGELKIRC